MLLCSYRCRHGGVSGPAPTWDSRTKWRVSERPTVKELGTNAVDVLDKYFISYGGNLHVALYSDPLMPTLSNVASIYQC